MNASARSVGPQGAGADRRRRLHPRRSWTGCTPAGWAYSVGFTLPDATPSLLERIPDERRGPPAYDAEGQVRDGAMVAELTGLLDLTGWPPGMRVIVRKERPHPGAQLRITDVDGWRVTAFATNTPPGGPVASCPTWSCGTAAAPAPRTGSGA